MSRALGSESDSVFSSPMEKKMPKAKELLALKKKIPQVDPSVHPRTLDCSGYQT